VKILVSCIPVLALAPVSAINFDSTGFLPGSSKSGTMKRGRFKPDSRKERIEACIMSDRLIRPDFDFVANSGAGQSL
jgi:hypothetical protein